MHLSWQHQASRGPLNFSFPYFSQPSSLPAFYHIPICSSACSSLRFLLRTCALCQAAPRRREVVERYGRGRSHRATATSTFRIATARRDGSLGSWTAPSSCLCSGERFAIATTSFPSPPPSPSLVKHRRSDYISAIFYHCIRTHHSRGFNMPSSDSGSDDGEVRLVCFNSGQDSNLPSTPELHCRHRSAAGSRYMLSCHAGGSISVLTCAIGINAVDISKLKNNHYHTVAVRYRRITHVQTIH